MIKKCVLYVCFLFIYMMPCLVKAEVICDCERNACICFIQKGDEGIAVKGIIEHLYEAGYLKSSKGSLFDDSVYEAVCCFQSDSGIQETGMMDDETLTQLLWNQSNVQMRDERSG